MLRWQQSGFASLTDTLLICGILFGRLAALFRSGWRRQSRTARRRFNGRNTASAWFVLPLCLQSLPRHALRGICKRHYFSKTPGAHWSSHNVCQSRALPDSRRQIERDYWAAAAACPRRYQLTACSRRNCDEIDGLFASKNRRATASPIISNRWA